jgi:hypothetical protein
MAFDETWGWLPGSDKVKELEKQKAQREAFLKHRRERKPGKLTDDF